MFDKYESLVEAMEDGLDYLERREAFRKRIKEDPELLQKFRIRRARRRAANIGLGYWPALIDPRVDERAYLVAERICHEVYKRETGKDLPLYDSRTESHGIWDSEGCWGVSPHAVERIWLKFGAKDCPKFRIAVENYYKIVILDGGRNVFSKIIHDLGEMSTWKLACFFKGLRWLSKNNRDVYRYNNKTITALGRLSLVSRWAALYNIDEDAYRVIRLRDLNWSLVKKAKGKISLLDKHTDGVFPPKGLWWNKFFPELSKYKEVRKVQFIGILPGALKKALEEFQPSEEAEIISLINLVKLFGKDIQTIRKIITKDGLHDAGMFVLPDKPFSKEWGKWLISHQSAWAWTHMLADIEMELGRLPKDTAEFQKTLNTVLEKDPEQWLKRYGVSKTRKYLKLFKRPHKDYEAIPNVKVSKDGYLLTKLDADDRRQPLAGLLTDCCQHLENVGKPCAVAAWKRGDCAIWALSDKKGNIVAQSFVWRSKNSIVLDSVEAKKGFRKDWVARMFYEASVQALGKLSVKKVYVGYNYYGLTDKVMKLCQSKVRKKPKPLEGKIKYTDAKRVKLLCKL